MTFQRKTKYLVLKLDDIEKYLSVSQKYDLFALTIPEIQRRRKMDGKKDNSYVVVNEEEPYAEVVWGLIELGETDPQSLTMLLSNIDADFLLRNVLKETDEPR